MLCLNNHDGIWLCYGVAGQCHSRQRMSNGI